MPACLAGPAGPESGAVNPDRRCGLIALRARCYACRGLSHGMGVVMSVARGGDARPGLFQDKTVLIAGAGCEVGQALCLHYTRAGARVVAVDNDEAAMIALARQAPDRLDALALDLWRPAACRRLGEAWQDEPLHVLVLLQPLSRPRRPAAAMAVVELLTEALLPGLTAGRGRALVMMRGVAPDDSVTAGLLHGAMRRLAAGLDARHCGAGVTVNAVLLPPGAPDGPALGALWQAAIILTAPGGARVGGAVLPLVT